MSAALASRSLTMKLACRSETTAPPMRSPLSPACSIKRAAKSPSGLRNTDPAFAVCTGWAAALSESKARMRAAAAPSGSGASLSRALTKASPSGPITLR